MTAISFSSCKSAGVERVVLGDEQEQACLPLLKGKSVALFSNHTGIVGDKIILADGPVHYGGNDLYGKDDEGSLRKQIFEGKSAAEIKKEWQVETEAFKNQRKKYLLYNES